VKDVDGARAQTVDDGYALKAESAAMALEPLGLGGLRIGFFNAFGDDPSRLRDLLFESLRGIRIDFRTRLCRRMMQHLEAQGLTIVDQPQGFALNEGIASS